MATSTKAAIADPIGTAIFTVTETSSKLEGGAVTLDTTSGSIIQVEIDNSNNTTPVYLNLYDVAGGVGIVIGTTDESFVFKAPGSQKITYSCPDGAEYANGVKAAIVSTPGGSIGPASTVTAYIMVNT